LGNVVVVSAQSSHVEIRTGEARVLLVVVDLGAKLAGFALRGQQSL
jgi:hypothetical protein